MKNRKTAIILACTLILAILAGCGGGESSASNIGPGATKPVSTGSDLTPSPGVSDSPDSPLTPTTTPATTTPHSAGRDEQIEIKDGVTAEKYTGSFEDGPTFSIYVSEGYVGGMQDNVMYIRSDEKPKDAYIEIHYIKGGKADELAPSALDEFDEIKSLTDHDTAESDTGLYRFIEAEGKNANWKAYLLEGFAGTLKLVVKESPSAPNGAGADLEAMVKTFSVD